MAKKTVSAFTDKAAALLDEQAVQIDVSTPEDLKKEIDRTRVHMDENLALLGRKLSPKRLKALQIPLALAFLAGAGLFLFLRSRKGWRVKSRRAATSTKTKYDIKRVRLGTLGRWGQLRTFLQLVSQARRGKPTVFIVQPMQG